jgi:nucleotide-binding universal stress UspA family protein
MACKTILVYLNDIQRAERLLSVAVPLALHHKAHLIGLSVVPPYVIVPAYEAAGAGVTVDDHRIAYISEMGKLKALFNERGQKEGLSIEWSEADANFGTAAAQVLDYARCADLIVISQSNPKWTFTSYLEDENRIVIEAGRPVIVVPNNGKAVAPPKRVLIAWNGRREAARAAFDAAQFLSAGVEATILWVDVPADRLQTGEIPGTDLAIALARHGLTCDVATIHAVNGEAGDAILKEATARGADLIVMGAYGHTRAREFFLGGASRELLSRMDRPILMSH